MWLSAPAWLQAVAQSNADRTVLRGLAPVTVLLNTGAGKAALGANYAVTGGIQTGAIRQPTLLPFSEQEHQALRDAFITDVNLAQLAGGLGSTLGSAYFARFHYMDPKRWSRLPPAVADLVHYAETVTGSHSTAGKYLFANGTADGKTAVSPEATAILKDLGGTEDVFGKAYNLAAGTIGADAYGNSRPYQTETEVRRFAGNDYFNDPSDNMVYNRGPVMNLTNSPAYPSGHTTYGYTGAILLAILLPQRYSQMIARGAEYGNDRVLMGSHYVMDVLGGRTLALYDLAHLLANDPSYIGLSVPGTPSIRDFQAAIKEAREALTTSLQEGCGNTVEVCSREDTGRFSNPAANEAFYESTQTYGLPVVYAKTEAEAEDVGKLAPEAGYLLTPAFPGLTLAEADRILTETEGPGGGFLNDGSSFGVYSRLDLFAAALRAERAHPFKR